MYIKQDINYKRRIDLEGMNLHLVVVDIEAKKKFRLINIYRPFQNQLGLSQREIFSEQISKIKIASVTPPDTLVVIMGDFNLDDKHKNDNNYRNHEMFELLNESFDALEMIQLITFPTWSRLVNNSLKISILDHVYIKDPTEVTYISNLKPIIGDHLCVIYCLNTSKVTPRVLLKRDWRYYSKDNLELELGKNDWSFDADSVQEYWNILENKIINIVDAIVPIVEFQNNSVKNSPTPIHIKTKMNTRKRLLKQFKNSPTERVHLRIKNLNAEIRTYFYSTKKHKIRKGIIPGNSKSLWDAVKISKDSDTNPLPYIMEIDGNQIEYDELPDAFAHFFKDKIEKISNECIIDRDVYNGRRLCTSADKHFMLSDIVL